jgi:hypothetical protein
MVEPTEPEYPDYNDCLPSTPAPVAPDYNAYTDYWGYTDWDAYDAAYNEYSAQVDTYNQEWSDLYDDALEAYNQAYTEFETAYTEYSKKLDRDSIRESIEGQTITTTEYTLYYYDTKDSKVVTDSYASFLDYSSEKPIIVYENYNKGEYTRVNMSDVTTYDDIYNLASSATIYDASEAYIAVNSETSKIDQENASSFRLKSSGEALYYLDNFNEENGYGDLYEMKINGTKPGVPEKYESKVYRYQLLGEDKLLYYKSVKDNSGDLYLNKELIDSDVYLNSILTMDASDSIVYYVDYDEEDQKGTLTIYKGKDAVTIGEDVHSYSAYDDKKIVYLTDYNIDKYTGDAYLYKGSGKKVKIDDDVTALIPTYNGIYRGYIDYGYDETYDDSEDDYE